ncbi:MAG: hypothetical protein J5848_02330 [Bacteroidales bacterium]|nr:hypothetical protein [Bacteroidales bacterium]
MTIYIFNPEHDLCLANGDRNFVPPSSALAFARSGVGAMRIIYGDNAVVIAADDYKSWRQNHPHVELNAVVPWGWNKQLKQTLLRQGMELEILPDDRKLESIRKLQHRTTVLPLQPHAWSCCSVDEVRQVLTKNDSIVLKAPWSGSGRGIRWVDGDLSQNDISWINKTVSIQRCVIAEQRKQVTHDFALEYVIKDHKVHFVGYSLFETQSGVYRCNILLPDDDICKTLQISDGFKTMLAKWLELYIAQTYEGYVGIDMYKTPSGEFFVSEMNLRHTMGLVAHQYLLRHPEAYGTKWNPEL